MHRNRTECNMNVYIKRAYVYFPDIEWIIPIMEFLLACVDKTTSEIISPSSNKQNVLVRNTFI